MNAKDECVDSSSDVFANEIDTHKLQDSKLKN